MEQGDFKDRLKKVEERVDKLEQDLRRLTTNVASLGGVLQLDSRVRHLEQLVAELRQRA